MNTSLTLSRPAVTVRKPVFPNILALIEGFFKLLFTTADDPAALHYMRSKYNGEID